MKSETEIREFEDLLVEELKARGEPNSQYDEVVAAMAHGVAMALHWVMGEGPDSAEDYIRILRKNRAERRQQKIARTN